MSVKITIDAKTIGDMDTPTANRLVKILNALPEGVDLNIDVDLTSTPSNRPDLETTILEELQDDLNRQHATPPTVADDVVEAEEFSDSEMEQLENISVQHNRSETKPYRGFFSETYEIGKGMGIRVGASIIIETLKKVF